MFSSQPKTTRFWDESVELPLNFRRDPEMPTATVVEGYTRNDILREVLIWANRDLSEKQFYEWLPYCLVERKPLYTKRDVSKFVFVASYLSRDRNLDRARTALIADIEQNPEKYQSC